MEPAQRSRAPIAPGALGEADRAAVRRELGELVGSDVFARKPMLRKLVERIVERSLAGDRAGLTAYSLGVDAMGRASGFDPQTDPSVRVAVGRLRRTLEAHYASRATKPGAGDHAWRIVIPQGAYEAHFVPPAPSAPIGPTAQANATGADPEAQAPHAASWPSRPSWPMVAGVMALCLVLLSALFLWRGGSPAAAPATFDRPIIDVAEFSDLSARRKRDDDASFLLEGLRQQFIVDLSHFRTVMVRDAAMTDPDRVEPTPDYVLRGQRTPDDAAGRLSLSLVRREDGQVVWSSRIGLPRNDGEFNVLMATTMRALVAAIASGTGVLQSEGMRRLEARRAGTVDPDGNEYACLLTARAADNDKLERSRNVARHCLGRAIRAGSTSSSIWAHGALVHFLDYVTSNSPDARELIGAGITRAREAIRLDPRNAESHLYLGSLLSVRGDRDGARHAWLAAQALNPSEPTTQVLLGFDAMQRGRWREGEAMAMRGLALAPRAAGWMRIPAILAAVHRGDWEGALAQASLSSADGDARGTVLAVAAASALGRAAQASRLRADLPERMQTLHRAMLELERSFALAQVLATVRDTLARSGLFDPAPGA